MSILLQLVNLLFEQLNIEMYKNDIDFSLKKILKKIHTKIVWILVERCTTVIKTWILFNTTTLWKKMHDCLYDERCHCVYN